MAAVGQKNALVFEGVIAEQYKQKRNKWIRVSIIGTFLPFVLPVIINIFGDDPNFVQFFENGEIILPLFTLCISLAFDLFDMKGHEDEHLSVAFWLCIVIAILQLVIYCSIRITNSEHIQCKSMIASCILIIASAFCCNNAIKAMFNHSISTEEGE